MNDKAQDIFSIKGKVACVTGASSGIGRYAARYLTSKGAQVIALARRKDQLETLKAECGESLSFVQVDIADIQGLEALAAKVSSFYGAPHILINAAGLNGRQYADDVSHEVWQQTLDINVSAPFFLAQAFVPAMRAQGWGRIVNFASLQSFRAFTNGIAYGASKGAVAQMTRAMAEAWSAQGINANAIAPGFFETELTKAVFADKERAQRNAQQTCIGRNGVMSDLEGPLQFLCSEA